jgi:hypothetical protein
MVNYTRKKRCGGSSNIFSKYQPDEIRKKLDNYLAAAYALKQSTETLNESVIIKNNSTDKESSGILDKANSQLFLNAAIKMNELITSLKTNIS